MTGKHYVTGENWSIIFLRIEKLEYLRVKKCVVPSNLASSRMFLEGFTSLSSRHRIQPFVLKEPQACDGEPSWAGSEAGS